MGEGASSGARGAAAYSAKSTQKSASVRECERRGDDWMTMTTTDVMISAHSVTCSTSAGRDDVRSSSRSMSFARRLRRLRLMARLAVRSKLPGLACWPDPMAAWAVRVVPPRHIEVRVDFLGVSGP